jgi:protoporphyrinogen/coproporphyrinogen III oxidase
VQGLQPLPSGLLSLFTLPLGRLVLRSVLAEPFVPANRPKQSSSQQQALPPSQPPAAETASSHTVTPTSAAEAEENDDEDEDDEGDESVDSFFSRRFGDAFARTLGSAFVHGVYATDSRLLSVRAAFPVLRESETRGRGSVVWGELGPPAWFAGWGQQGAGARPEEVEEGAQGVDPGWEKRFRASAALFSFKEGMETLVRALVQALRGFPNVTLRSGTAVRGIIVDDVAADDGGNSDDRRFSFQVRVS